MGRYLCLEPILPVATPVAGLWRSTCKPYAQEIKSGSVTITGDFWQPFCVGENNGGLKARPRKTTIARGRQYYYSTQLGQWSCARPTELPWSDVRDTYASSRHFLLAQKSARKITENRDTAPLTLTSGLLASLWGRCFEFFQECLTVFSCTQSSHNSTCIITQNAFATYWCRK